MISSIEHRFDVLVVGGGPAGISAAVRAREGGAHVGLVDDNPAAGGQIWRGESTVAKASEAAEWLRQLRTLQVETLYGQRVIDQPRKGTLLAEAEDELRGLRYEKLILATGARERFLPFPGWTLPNVIGAGGLQALVKSGLPIAKKRVVVAGTGPLLLAVAAYLRRHGADIRLVCEQAPLRSLLPFAVALAAHPGKIVEAFQWKRDLGGVRQATSCWPVAAQGGEVLESVTVTRRGRSETIACDYLACGFHLVPNTELASLLGCGLKDGAVEVDDFQQTTVPEILCAGEPTGIGGVDLALVEGQIAGLAACGRRVEARALFAPRKKFRKFATALANAFQLRAELRELPSAETLVCRCEDVAYSRLCAYSSWRAAKLQTRCGMGSCQGRVCGPATEFLFRWSPDSVRPPIFPARVESLAAFSTCAEPEPRTTGGH